MSALPGRRIAERRTEHLTLPLTEKEMRELDSIAQIWGRKKTELARELMLSALRNLPAPQRPVPLPGAA